MRRATVAADVLIARDGEEAIRMMKETKPDFILLDLNIPKLDGIAVLEYSRALENAPPVVMLTGL